MKFLFVSLFVLSTSLYAQTTIETLNFQSTADAIEKLTRELGISPSEVLVVHDIDNTLLAHDHDLGSDQWFRWQASLIETRSKYKIANNFEELLVWYNEALKSPLATTHLTDPNINHVLNTYKNIGYSMMALTARGPESLEPTLRELKRNRISYAYNAPIQKITIKGHIKPLAKPVTYINGLALINGQDKGELIKYLINESKKSYQLVVIVDDSPKNVVNVHRAFQNTGIHTLGVRFASEDKNVAKFFRNNKIQVFESFKNLNAICNLKFTK